MMGEMNGDGDKLLIFGSFTKNETILFQGQSASPAKQGGLLFGSLDNSCPSSPSGSSPTSKNDKSLTGSAVRQNDAVISDKISNNIKGNAGGNLPNGKPVLVNGCLGGNQGPLSNGVLQNGKGTLHSVMNQRTYNKGSKVHFANANVNQCGVHFNQANGVVPTTTSLKDLSINLNNMSPINKTLLPHGLRNTGNICFLNATLQALLSCSLLVELLEDLMNKIVPKIEYPTLSAFVELLCQFYMPEDTSVMRNEKSVQISGKSVTPIMFDPVLRNFTPDVHAATFARPRQEDAQEFLSFVMDCMHEELLKLNGNLSNSKEGMFVSAAEDDVWETVGPKNKSAITRTQSFVPSKLSAIFGGELQSVVKAAGNKASATIQPFLLLHLDIFPENIQTLEDALHLFSAPESLEGYRTSAGKAGLVSARKSVKIHTLPRVMVLHLKRFSYGTHGCAKINKQLDFPAELVLSRDLLVSPTAEGKKYELFSTITHHGRDPSRGHYTADARNVDGQWLHYDDASVTCVTTKEVLQNQAYVLFYQQV